MVKDLGQVCSLSNDIELTVISSVISSVVLLCSERLRSFQQRDGRNTLRSGVEHDQPPAEDRRRGDVKYGGFGVRPPYGY